MAAQKLVLHVTVVAVAVEIVEISRERTREDNCWGGAYYFVLDRCVIES